MKTYKRATLHHSTEMFQFYDLGGIPGLQELPRTQDSHSPPIFVPDGLIFGDEIVTQIYVSKTFQVASIVPYSLLIKCMSLCNS